MIPNVDSRSLFPLRFPAGFYAEKALEFSMSSYGGIMRTNSNIRQKAGLLLAASFRSWNTVIPSQQNWAERIKNQHLKIKKKWCVYALHTRALSRVALSQEKQQHQTTAVIVPISFTNWMRIHARRGTITCAPAALVVAVCAVCTVDGTAPQTNWLCVAHRHIDSNTVWIFSHWFDSDIEVICWLIELIRTWLIGQL